MSTIGKDSVVRITVCKRTNVKAISEKEQNEISDCDLLTALQEAEQQPSMSDQNAWWIPSDILPARLPVRKHLSPRSKTLFYSDMPAVAKCGTKQMWPKQQSQMWSTVSVVL